MESGEKQDDHSIGRKDSRTLGCIIAVSPGKLSEAKKGILRDVVLWGVTDRFSWKNNFPAPGRTDAPLLFDVNGKEKPAFFELIK